MATAPLTAAEEARLAHQVLRLKESQVERPKQVADLARAELLRRTANPEEADAAFQRIRTGGPKVERLGGVGLAVQNALEEAAPGPTAPKRVEELMDRSLTDIWKEWDAAVTQNLEETLSASDLKAWRESVERDQRAFEERAARMTETGDWPVHPYFGHLRHEAGAANALFDLGREGFLDGSIDWDTAVIKAILVDSADYTVNLATHQFLSSVAAGAREETSAALANKTKAAGVADADDVTFTAAAGDPCEAIILVQSSAVGGGADVADTAQRLIGYIDTATGLPVILNGGNINVAWDSGANRIFKL